MIKPISVLKNAFFLSIACKHVQNAGYVCIPCMWDIEKIDGVPLVFITEIFFFFFILFLSLNSYLENLCIGQKFKRLVSDSMLSSCWGSIFYRPLLTNIAGHNCAIIFLHIPYLFPEERQNTY